MSRQSDGKSASPDPIDRQCAGNPRLDHHVACSERLVLDEHLEQRERLIRRRVDHGNPFGIPPAAVEPRTLSRKKRSVRTQPW